MNLLSSPPAPEAGSAVLDVGGADKGSASLLLARGWLRWCSCVGAVRDESEGKESLLFMEEEAGLLFQAAEFVY